LNEPITELSVTRLSTEFSIEKTFQFNISFGVGESIIFLKHGMNKIGNNQIVNDRNILWMVFRWRRLFSRP
jgi:hypothetical protein